MMLHRYRTLILFAFLCAASSALVSQDWHSVPMSSDHWIISAKESRFVDHMGRPALQLRGGMAQVRNSQFTDGVIDFDMAFDRERGFMGVVWRVVDGNNYEEFYIRPHQSGNPDANQYQPVYNGVAAWQLYNGESFGTPVSYAFNEWVHIRVVVAGSRADIYISDLVNPVLAVDLKRSPMQGGLGLLVGNFMPAYYSNFRYTTSVPVLKGNPIPEKPALPGTIMSWQVSNLLGSSQIAGKHVLTDEFKNGLTWTRWEADWTGITNLAKCHIRKDTLNTVLVRVILRSDREQVCKLTYGFSDAVQVYCNGRAIAGGSDLYQSRDYRFLGTIGLFDDVYLPLARGDNEVWFAVTENFGGWGIIARLDNTDGLSIR